MAFHSHPRRQDHLVELDCHATLKETFSNKFFIALSRFNLSIITVNPVMRKKHVLSSVMKATQKIVWRNMAMWNLKHGQLNNWTLKIQYTNFWLNMYCLQRWGHKLPSQRTLKGHAPCQQWDQEHDIYPPYKYHHRGRNVAYLPDCWF